VSGVASFGLSCTSVLTHLTLDEIHGYAIGNAENRDQAEKMI